MREDRKVKIKKTDGCTIYFVGIRDRFRIKQISDNKFIIQKQFKETEAKGYLWWKDTHTWNEWKRVDKNGEKYYSRGRHIHISNANRFKTYKTLDKAIKWIEDYNKYPIYH